MQRGVTGLRQVLTVSCKQNDLIFVMKLQQLELIFAGWVEHSEAFQLV